MSSLPTLLKVFLITTLSTMPIGLVAKDGLLFNDIPPVSILFEGSFTGIHRYNDYCIRITNTSDDTIHDVTFSRVIDGSVKKEVVTPTIPPHKSAIITSNFTIKLGPTGPNSGLTVTCKGYSKPLPVDGWWEGEKEEQAQKDLKAAKEGDSDAQCSIGIAYYFAEGMPKNTSEGIKWALQSSESGNYYGMRLLCHIYAGGETVEANRNENLVESMKWMLILAREKQELREVDKATVAKKITGAQIEEAQRLANAWKSPARKFIEQSLLPKK